jgi:hypothetical protein
MDTFAMSIASMALSAKWRVRLALFFGGENFRKNVGGGEGGFCCFMGVFEGCFGKMVS